MGDLISRSALLKNLTDWRLQECPVGVCDEETETYKTICECIEAVREQPTAFDMDNVRKDLKYYLEINEEKGVVCIPKFMIEKWIKAGEQNG